MKVGCWVKLDRRGEPEMYSHPPEQFLAAMCAGLAWMFSRRF